LPGWTNEAYTDDANGNRLTGNGSTYSTGDSNPMNSDGTYTYEYDGEGNVQYKKQGGIVVQRFYYDNRNRMTRVENFNTSGVITSCADYTYDAFNHRVRSEYDSNGPGTPNGLKREFYIWDGRNIVMDFLDNDGPATTYQPTLSSRNLWGEQADQLLSVNDSGSIWTLTDRLGSVRDVVSAYRGTMGAYYRVHGDYYSFGKVNNAYVVAMDGTPMYGNSLPRFQYTAQEWDSYAGLYYYNARWYDSATGRFWQQDPIGFAAGDANLYRYVNNSPTNATDPTGKKGFEIINKGIREGERGGFDVFANWHVSPAPKAKSWIIQKIHATFTAEYCDSGNSWKPIDDKRNDGKWDYWEAWPIEAGSNSPSGNKWNIDAGDDTFRIADGNFNTIIKGKDGKNVTKHVKTRGKITLTGDAGYLRFYNLPGGTPSWPQPNPGTHACTLPAITQWPQEFLFQPTIHRVAIATWGYNNKDEHTHLVYMVIPDNLRDPDLGGPVPV
jgi:RHS repeat-associated protein